MDKPIIKCIQLPHASDLPLPSYETKGAAGMDIRVALTKELSLEPGERELLPTGLKLSIPMGYEIQIRPRSGLAIKHGITMVNSPGTIDSDFERDSSHRYKSRSADIQGETWRSNSSDECARTTASRAFEGTIKRIRTKLSRPGRLRFNSREITL